MSTEKHSKYRPIETQSQAQQNLTFPPSLPAIDTPTPLTPLLASPIRVEQSYSSNNPPAQAPLGTPVRMSFLRHITIEPVVLLYVFAIFAEYVVIEDLFYVSNCARSWNLTSDSQIHICVENKKKNHTGPEEAIWKDISTRTNHSLLLYNGILFACSIVSSFISAAYSDRRTKLAPILLAILGSATVQVLILTTLMTNSSTGLAYILQNNFILFVCCAISGASGGTSTLISNCFAHVAEKCSPENRTTRITIVEACLFGGGFLGFTFAGAILRGFPASLDRYFWNFGAFFVTHALLAIYVLVRRGMFHRPRSALTSAIDSGWKSIPMLFTSVLRTIFRPRAQRKAVLLILGAFVLISFWSTTLSTLMFIYTRNPPLAWPSWQYSYFNSAKFALCGIFLVLLPIWQHLRKERWQQQPLSDVTIIQLGLISRGISIIIIGLATSTSVMLIALAGIILAEYPIPAIRSMMSKIIEPNEKAQVFVFMATIQSLCFLVGGVLCPIIYNIIHNNFSHSSTFNPPGVIFITIGVFQFISMLVFRHVKRILKETPPSTVEELPKDEEVDIIE